MIHKVLIANRGEIAVRIIRTCREMGIKTVAVFSTVDRDALHVGMADQSVCIGPPPSAESYLNIPAILSAVEITDADSVHPGYGFLAENAAFAEICQNYGVKFIGPSSEAIRLMGDKIEARKAVQKAKVPVVPGSEMAITEEEEGLRIAKDLGFPVIVKAAAGGGGRGMKIVHSPASFINAFLTAQSEALSAFGVADVYIEKYFDNARHVEVQVMGDRHGNVVHLGDRDC
ncbi:MAG: biotin carboxylase N-terminal domain-containing protein, partial [Verrucomicrobiota bacterium]